MSARTRSRSRLPVRYFDDRILLTEAHAWASYQLPTQAYELQAMGLEDEAITAGEIARWADHAERLGRALAASALATRHASSDELACLIRHTLMGTADNPRPSAMPRRRWGAGEIESLYEGQLHNGRTILRLEQPEGQSWQAFRPFPRFPDVMSFPEGEPWLHFADLLPFQVEVSSRMRLISEGILACMASAVDRLISALGNAIQFSYLAPIEKVLSLLGEAVLSVLSSPLDSAATPAHLAVAQDSWN